MFQTQGFIYIGGILYQSGLIFPLTNHYFSVGSARTTCPSCNLVQQRLSKYTHKILSHCAALKQMKQTQ